MNPLYFLEHQFFPAVVYPDPEGKQISPFLLGNAFGTLCASVLADLPETGDENERFCQEEDFTAEGLEIRAAQLHNDAGMVGAVYYFRQSRGEI